jgi:hypothetical protein
MELFEHFTLFPLPGIFFATYCQKLVLSDE